MSTQSKECGDFTHRYWDKHARLLTVLISGVVALGTTLILGSYGYTWVEMKAEQEEKRVWRKDFQEQLDKRFAEVKEGQKELADNVRESNTATKDMLQRILLKLEKGRN